jgi:hypothetical protein
MDWFTILLIFIFFILPLIQQVLEQTRKKGPPRPEDNTYDDHPSYDEIELGTDTGDLWSTAEAEVETNKARPESGSWSDSWGSWPGQGKPDAAPADAKPAPPKPREKKPRPWIPPTPAPQQTLPAPYTPPPAPKVTGRVKLRPVSAPAPTPRNSPRITRTGAPLTRRMGLGSVHGLRKAMVLIEVLGPPVSLRGRDDETAI